MDRGTAVALVATAGAVVAATAWWLLRARSPRRAGESTFIRARSFWILVRGKKLRVVVDRRPAGAATAATTFFFIHGLGGHVEGWEAQLQHFRKDGNVVALDWVGHGRSEVHDDDAHYSADALLADLIDVYGRFATERNILVGHSYGTALTTMLVPHALKVAPVAAVVLIGAVASVPPVTAKTALRLASVPIWVLDLMRAFHRLGGVHSSSVRQMIYYPAASRELREQQLANNMRTSTPVVRALMVGMHWPTQADYEQLADIPTAVIHGKHDTVTPPARAQALQTWLLVGAPPSVTHLFVQIERTGHNVMMEAPNQVNAVIDTLLHGPPK